MLTLDLAKRALRNLVHNSVLSEPVRGKFMWRFIGHDATGGQGQVQRVEAGEGQKV